MSSWGWNGRPSSKDSRGRFGGSINHGDQVDLVTIFTGKPKDTMKRLSDGRDRLPLPAPIAARQKQEVAALEAHLANGKRMALVLRAGRP